MPAGVRASKATYEAINACCTREFPSTPLLDCPDCVHACTHRNHACTHRNVLGVTEADLIQTVASEANRQSMKASKRTVSGDHVEQAIEVRGLISGLVL